MQPHRRTLQGAPPGRVQEVHRRGTRHCPRRARCLDAAYGGGTEVRRDQAGGRVPLWHVLGRPLRLLSRPGQGQQPVLPWARAIRSSRFLALLSARNNGLAVRSGSPGPEQAGQTLFRRDHALRVRRRNELWKGGGRKPGGAFYGGLISPLDMPLESETARYTDSHPKTLHSSATSLSNRCWTTRT
jgi:hypothetical protein